MCLKSFSEMLFNYLLIYVHEKRKNIQDETYSHP